MIYISEFGLRIKNIKAATLYGYNRGTRERYDYKDAMFSKSLFSIHMEKNGLTSYKGESTRDIICLEFDFGTRSEKEELDRLRQMKDAAEDDGTRERIDQLIDKIQNNSEKYQKMSKEEIREEFYENDVEIPYSSIDKETGELVTETIRYRMLYRNASKAKTGQVMFINVDLYDHAYDWLTMGLGKKMGTENAKIVELSAYAPLTTSTIVDTVHIPVEDILILKDQDSFFTTVADIVKSAEYEAIEKIPCFENGKKKGFSEVKTTKKKCVVSREETDVKNTLWDGMALVDVSVFPYWVNGMGLLRNHFFKACGFKTLIQEFFMDWCARTGNDYETYEVLDMFGVSHKLKDIKVITTDNAIKWKKFAALMGNTMAEAYQYWCDRVNEDGSIFGIVKTDHTSKLGDVQQLSYQMINTLPCTSEDVKDIAQTSIDYVETLKNDNDEFEKFLRRNANQINHYEMMADLYAQNNEFGNSKWFRFEKSKIISAYVAKLRKGKITVNADNLTICGNPYALLLYSVGENWADDPTLRPEEGTIQCYTLRFPSGLYLAAFRNPHNSPNNICYLHNVHSIEMVRYFLFSPNIMAVNCIHTDIQDRANGCDFDSDFMFVTDHPTIVKYAKICYRDYPTIVNKLAESGITYQNTRKEYARMDNKFARSQRYIGESSNLAQLAMTYYWSDRHCNAEETERTKELYDNFVILSVLAQLCIDSCKREYEVDSVSEIERIKRMPCMNIFVEVPDEEKTKYVRMDFPKFMKYTKEVPVTKNGKELPYDNVKAEREKIARRINNDLVCPMNWLQDWLDKIQGVSKTNTIPTHKFFIKMTGKANDRQMTKIREIVEEYDRRTKYLLLSVDDEYTFQLLIDITNETLEKLKKIKIRNPVTINRLIETALGIDTNLGGKQYKEATKYTRKMLNLLYKADKTRFLANFTQKIAEC